MKRETSDVKRPASSLNIRLENIGRRFNHDWIFRNLAYTFSTGNSYAILGPNGSGKSTLLQVISGSLTPSSGILGYFEGEKEIAIEHVYRHLALAAPYQELIEEFSLREQVHFHFKFKTYIDGFDYQQVIALMGFENSQDKAIKNFSSGMKQRAKLALAVCSDTPVLLLDEPCSNLDKEGINWYHGLVSNYTVNRLLIVCSNQQQEYEFCKQQLLISDFK